MLRPFSGYRAIADERRGDSAATRALRGPARWLFVVACFVSLTTDGHFRVEHLLFSPLGWAFAPLLQAAGMFVAWRVCGVSLSLPHLLDLHFAGQGPWLFLLLAVAGLTAIAPSPWAIFEPLLSSGALPVLVLLATVACMFLTFALFRGGADLSWPRALAATLTYYVVYGGAIVGYFVVTGQILPLLVRGPA